MKKIFLAALFCLGLLFASPEARSEFRWERFGGDPYMTPKQLNDPGVVRAKLATARQNASQHGVSSEAAARFEQMGRAILIDGVMPAGCGPTIIPAGLHIGGMGTGNKQTFIPDVVVGPGMDQPGANNEATMCYVVGADRRSIQYFVIPKICHNIFFVVMINGECVYYVLA